MSRISLLGCRRDLEVGDRLGSGETIQGVVGEDHLLAAGSRRSARGITAVQQGGSKSGNVSRLTPISPISSSLGCVDPQSLYQLMQRLMKLPNVPVPLPIDYAPEHEVTRNLEVAVYILLPFCGLIGYFGDL